MISNELIAPDPISGAGLRSARSLLQRKQRQLQGQFLAEGRQAVAEALGEPGIVDQILVAEGAVDRHQDLLALAVESRVLVRSISGHDLARLSETVTPQGLIAVCRTVPVTVEEALGTNPQLVVVCDQIRDPGNLGTVIRCADAFGADAVIVTGDSVDVHNGKTVRASTGSLFHLPLAVVSDLADVVAHGRSAGLQILGSAGEGTATLDELARSGELARPTMWVLGNEAWGLPPESAQLLDRLVAVPMYGRAESLNLSTAAAVVLYATATAQRTPTA